MPKLKEITQLQNINTALEVFSLMKENPKMTQKDACEKVGIHPQTYRLWITQAEDSLALLADTISEVEREELATLLIAKNGITGAVIKDATAKFTSPGERLAIFMYINDRIDELAKRHRKIDNGVMRDAFGGPNLVEAKSRFTSQTLDVVAQDDGSVKISAHPIQVIDATTQQPQEPQPTS